MCAEGELQFPDESDPFHFELQFPVEGEGSVECRLTFQLPEEYPVKRLQISHISIACTSLSRDQSGLFREALRAYLQTLDEGDMQVMNAFIWAKDHVEDFTRKAAPERPQEVEEEDPYEPASKVTTLDLMSGTTAEGRQFLQALEADRRFHNYESVVMHPLWHRGRYSGTLRANYAEGEAMWCSHADQAPLVGSIYLTRDPSKTAGISVYCDALDWDLEPAFFSITPSAQESAWEASFPNNEEGLAAFAHKLKQKNLPQLLIEGACKLQARLLEEAGFDATTDDDLDVETLNTIDDSVRRALAGEFDPGRQFKIITYGRDVNGAGFGAGKVTDTRFNWSALGLTGRGKGLNTKKLDGRNVEVQGRTSRSDTFSDWMTEKVRMVEEWFKDEENKGCKLTVAIYCSKGRHRSVSAAILLRDLFYPNAECEGHGVVGGALRVVKPKGR